MRQFFYLDIQSKIEIKFILFTKLSYYYSVAEFYEIALKN